MWTESGNGEQMKFQDTTAWKTLSETKCEMARKTMSAVESGGEHMFWLCIGEIGGKIDSENFLVGKKFNGHPQKSTLEASKKNCSQVRIRSQVSNTAE